MVPLFLNFSKEKGDSYRKSSLQPFRKTFRRAEDGRSVVGKGDNIRRGWRWLVVRREPCAKRHQAHHDGRF